MEIETEMMKSIIIESVLNGWIVRPISERVEVGIALHEYSVFNMIEDLQAALPMLLDPSLKKMNPTKFCIPGDYNETR